MKNNRKIIIGAAAGCVVLGGILIGAGIAAGGSPAFYYDGDGIHVKENTERVVIEDYHMEQNITEEIREMNLSVQQARLRIEEGDTFSVEYVLNGARMEPVYTVENGVLTLRENENSKNYGYNWGWGWMDGIWDWGSGAEERTEPYVRVTIPEGQHFEQVNLFSQYGDISIQGTLAADSLEIENHSGDVDLDDWTGKNFLVDLNYGDLKTGQLSGEEATLRLESGDVNIGLLQVETAEADLNYGDLKADVSAETKLEANLESGGVKLRLRGGLDQFPVSLHTESGTIRMPWGEVRENEHDYSSDYVNYVEGDQDNYPQILVYTEYGDIHIQERTAEAPKADSAEEAETGTETETETGTEAGTKTETEKQTETGTKTKAETGVREETKTGREAETA